MGRCTKTIGERRLGRTIRKLENSVEFSSKECKAKTIETKQRQKTRQEAENSPVQNLREIASKGKKEQEKA